MSRAGLVAASEHASLLPSFRNLAEAQSSLFARRDADLAVLRDAAERLAPFALDFTPASLKLLEQWYFRLLDEDAFASAGFSRSAFERCVAAYLGEVLVKNRPPFEWFVAEDPFEPGKYEVGVRRPLYSLMLTLPLDLATRPNNKRRQSLWREYRQHAA